MENPKNQLNLVRRRNHNVPQSSRCLFRFVTSNTDENAVPEAEEEDSSGKCQCISYGAERRQRLLSGEERPDEFGGRSLPASEGRRTHTDAEDKPDVTLRQCSGTGEKPFTCAARQTALSTQRNVRHNERPPEDRSPDGKQSTSATTDAEGTKRSEPRQTVSHVSHQLLVKHSFFMLTECCYSEPQSGPLLEPRGTGFLLRQFREGGLCS